MKPRRAKSEPHKAAPPPGGLRLAPAQRAEAELRRLQRVKYDAPPAVAMLGAEMVDFFKQSVQKRQTKIGKIAEAFARLVPSPLAEHCCIEAYHRGTLTVLCDSSPHLFDFNTLLREGLLQQLLLACKSAGLAKITAKVGRWYEGDAAETRPRF